MWIFSVILILMISYFYMKKYETDFYEALPLSICSVLIFMYGLCFFRALPLLDWIGMGISVFFILKALLRKDKTGVVDFYHKCIANWQVITILAVLISLVVLTMYKAVIWWDDINFWATDAKFYYYYGGFAPKYGNVAAEFGDYPPLLSLMKWLFLHASASKFREGLMFAAYYFLMIILLLPLLVHGKKKKSPVFYFVAVPLLFCLYSVVESSYVNGCSADLVMAVLYGNLLWSIWKDKFHAVEVMIYGTALVLCKSVGIEWYGFAFIFAILLKMIRKNKDYSIGKLPWTKMLLVMGIPFAVWGSWMSFCLLNRRVAKLTGAGVKMAVNGNLSFLENASEKIRIFMEGFWLYPMHGKNGLTLDLSAGMFLILILLGLGILCKKKAISTEGKFSELRLMFLYTFVTSIAAYGIILLGHLTIFAGELQYQDPKIMAISLNRYGAPFTLGMAYLLLQIWLSSVLEENESQWRLKEHQAFLILFFIFIAGSHFGDLKNTFFANMDREIYESVLADRREMIEAEGQRYASECLKYPYLTGNRILYFREDEKIHWVKDAYINYEVSPMATVYAGINAEKMEIEEVINRIRNSHATYLYCDPVKGDLSKLMDGIMEEGSFEAESFYKIIETTDTLKLEKCVEMEK